MFLSMGLQKVIPITAPSAHREVIMSIAVFLESNAGELEGLPAMAQSLVFGYKDEVHIYHRVSNGSKGKGQAWKRVASDELYTLPRNPIANAPVGTVVTERDLAMVGLGQVTNIATKAIYANEKAEPITAPLSHQEAVILIGYRIMEGDPTLAELVSDERTNTGIADVTIEPMDNPIEKEVFTPVSIELTSPIGVTQTLADTEQTELAEMAMKMISVPDPKFGQQYINRRFDGTTEWEIYDHAKANAINVLLEGEAGSGKTMSVQSYASKRGLRYFNISSNQGIDPSQLFGRWIPRADGNGYAWQDGAVTLLFRHGGVLLINEVNFLPVRISTVLFSGLDYRREIQLLDNGGEVIKAHPDLLIVGDMNYGYKGTQELNQAFADRFGIKLEFPYDRAIENKVVNCKPLLALADQLREMYDKDEITTPISTRGLVSFVNNAKAFGVGFAITSFVNGFHKDERGGVRLACETHTANIALDLGQALPTYDSHANTSEVVNG